MPTYEYKCQACGLKFEKLQSMVEKAVEKCPECEGPVQRLIGGGSGVFFKGSGFYATDYGSKTSSSCGRAQPCCGRETPCKKKTAES